MARTDLRNFPRNDYDCGTKHYTKDCPGCRFNLPPPIKDGEACYWGVAWKYLSKDKKPRKCFLINKQSPREEGILRDISIKKGLENSQNLAKYVERYQKEF